MLSATESVQDMEPSAYGFRSIRARTREERRALNDKVALEKNRIKQRVGHEARMQRENAPDSSAGLTSCIDGGAGYMADADRFHTDTVGEEYQRRRQEIEKRNRAIEFRRNQASNREEDRWKKIDEKKAQEKEYWDNVRAEGKKDEKNHSKVAYNITTLEYHSDDKGRVQKYQDDMVRYRADARTKHLVDKGDSRATYDIISGGQRREIKGPSMVPQHPHRSTSNLIS